MVFIYAENFELIERRLPFRKPLALPKREELRRHKQRTQAENGKKLYEAAEIRRILEAADPQMKAMVLLGINCGYGNHDCVQIEYLLPLDRSVEVPVKVLQSLSISKGSGLDPTGYLSTSSYGQFIFEDKFQELGVIES